MHVMRLILLVADELMARFESIELENTSFWTDGDDWHTFQEFSRG